VSSLIPFLLAYLVARSARAFSDAFFLARKFERKFEGTQMIENNRHFIETFFTPGLLY
jgi:hypothetical protein